MIDVNVFLNTYLCCPISELLWRNCKWFGSLSNDYNKYIHIDLKGQWYIIFQQSNCKFAGSHNLNIQWIKLLTTTNKSHCLLGRINLWEQTPGDRRGQCFNGEHICIFLFKFRYVRSNTAFTGNMMHIIQENLHIEWEYGSIFNCCIVEVGEV